MPSDLQIIDGFEGLRSAYMEAHPGAAFPGPPDGEPKRQTPEDFLEAWLKTALDWDELSGWQKRTLRQLIKLIGRYSELAPGETENLDPKIARLIREHPRLLQDGGKVLSSLEALSGRREGIESREETISAAARAGHWRKSLPGLSGLRVWRFLAHLGAPVIPPGAPIRRFFWRLGMLEGAPSPSSAFLAQTHACIEQSMRLAGMNHFEMERLLNWHTTGEGRGVEAGRCGRKPDCDGCSFSGCCLWFRFRGRMPPEEERARDEAPQDMNGVKQRFDAQGGENLPDIELLALILHTSSGGRMGIKLAEDLLQAFGGLRGLHSCTIDDLKNFEGIGEARARQIKASIELGRRVMEHPLNPGAPIGGSQEVWLAYRARYRHIPQEHMMTLLLDTKNRPIGQPCLVSKGTLNASLAHPREVFKPAIRQSASAIILIHNHPSGDPSPSSEDCAVTRQMVEAGRILGIRVLDHIILGQESYYSFKDEGRM